MAFSSDNRIHDLPLQNSKCSSTIRSSPLFFKLHLFVDPRTRICCNKRTYHDVVSCVPLHAYTPRYKFFLGHLSNTENNFSLSLLMVCPPFVFLKKGKVRFCYKFQIRSMSASVDVFHNTLFTEPVKFKILHRTVPW